MGTNSFFCRLTIIPMRRTLLKIAISVLAFGLGVGVTVGWQLYQWSLVPYEVSPGCCAAAKVVVPPGKLREQVHVIKD